MATDLQESLRRIGDKCRFLTERYRVVGEQRDNALAEVGRLRNELVQRDKELERLRLEVEYLKVSATIAPSFRSVDRTRAIVSELVRDIDRCLAELKE